MRSSFFRRLRFAIAATLTGILVLLAVGISLARVLIVYAPQFRAELETALSELVQRPLTVGGLRAEWTGRHPTLILQDVRLAGGPATGLAMNELEISIDLLASLRDGKPRPAAVTLSAMHLTVTYAADGTLRLSRIGDVELPPLSPDESGMPVLPAEVHLRAATVELVDVPNQQRYRFPQVDLWMSSDGAGYSLAGYLQLPSALGRSARFRAEWQAGPPGGLDGHLYVDTHELNLETTADLLRRVAPTPRLQGRADGELWFDVADSRLTMLSGRLKAVGVRGRADEQADWQSLAAQFGGRFRWQRGEHGWQLDAEDLLFASDYRVWPKHRLALRFSEQGGASTLEASTGYLRLDDLTPLISVLPLPQAWRDRLLAHQPVGEVLEPSGRLQWDAQGLSGYRLSGRFRGLGLAPIGRLPGVSGLAGRVSMDATGGSMILDTHGGRLDFGELFRAPIPFSKLRAQLGWRIDGDSWRLEAPLLSVENEDAQVEARLRLFAERGASPVIDLRAHLSDGNGDMASRYLPAGILSKELLAWLDGAIRGGKVPQADVALFGRLDQFPYRDANGVFDVQAEVTEGSLAYQPGWPGIDDINGTLRFFADRMDISADKGSISGAHIEQATVSLANFEDADLHVEGRVRGEGKALLGFLRDSPLGRSIREQLAGISLSGVHELSLRADIPVLSERNDLSVAGTLDLQQGGLSLPAWNLNLTELQGPVRFTERGVSAPAVSARYRNRDITLSAQTGIVDRRELIRVSTRLRATPQELMGVPTLAGVSGAAAWNVDLLLPAFQAAGAGPGLVLRLESDLRGLAVDLPAPLAKPAGEPRRLAIELSADASGLGPVSMAYGQELHALLQLDAQRTPRKVALSFGASKPELPATPGIAVNGRISVLDLDAWRTWVSQLTGPRSAGAEKAGPMGALPLLGVDLRADRLRLLGQDFSQTGFTVRRQAQQWRLGFEGPDLAGTATLPDSPTAIAKIDLSLLRLRSGAPAGDGGAVPPPADAGAKAAAAPAVDIPPLDLSVADLRFGEDSLGRLQLSLRQDGTGMRIESASLKGPALEAVATGGWGGQPVQSRLTVDLSSDNAGKALARFGYPEMLVGGVTTGNVSLQWPGGPAAFAPALLSGTIDLSLRDGSVLAVEPGAGRLFGLMSITDLPRRLSLNFADLFEEGFAFDRIEAHYRVDNGNAYTRLFYMEGPAARVDLRGRIGWGSRDYDQEVTVTPHISNALPVIGALAGGPVAAGVMFITQKLLEKQLNKLTRYRYRVTGSWDDPSVEVLDQPADSPPAATTNGTSPAGKPMLPAPSAADTAPPAPSGADAAPPARMPAPSTPMPPAAPAR